MTDPTVRSPAAMTSEAKAHLSKTIRALRVELIEALGHAVQGTYLFGVPIEEAGLTEAQLARRARLESWLGEQTRAIAPSKREQERARFLSEAIKEAAATWLNRLIVLRLLEANGHLKERVLSKGWSSPAQARFRVVTGELAAASESEGYAVLLGLVFDELSLVMPGLLGGAGTIALVPMPLAMLRRLVEAINDPLLDGCWRDDTTLGLGLPVLERPGARGDRRQAPRGRQGRATRDRVENAAVHRALHGQVAAPELAGLDVAGDLREAGLGAGVPRRRHPGAA